MPTSLLSTDTYLATNAQQLFISALHSYRLCNNGRDDIDKLICRILCHPKQGKCGKYAWITKRPTVAFQPACFHFPRALNNKAFYIIRISRNISTRFQSRSKSCGSLTRAMINWNMSSASRIRNLQFSLTVGRTKKYHSRTSSQWRGYKTRKDFVKSVMPRSKQKQTVCCIFGSIRVASIKPEALSCQRQSIPCFVGIQKQAFAMPTYRTSNPMHQVPGRILKEACGSCAAGDYRSKWNPRGKFPYPIDSRVLEILS